MPYTAGTQAADTNPALVYMNYLDTALLAAGYVFVEQQVSGNTTRVYKSPAANNSANLDWYLLVRRAADTSTTIQVTCCEQYNSSTHLCFYYIPEGGTPDANGGVNDPAGKAPTYAFQKLRSLNISTAGFIYTSSLTGNRVVIGSSIGGTNYVAYCGLYDDFYLSPTYPALCVFHVHTASGGTSAGGTTRELGTGLNSSNFICDKSMQPYTPVYAGNAYIGGATTMARGYMPGARGPKGLLKDVWIGSAGGTNGDTMTATINGVAKTLAQIMPSGGTPTFVDTAL